MSNKLSREDRAELLKELEERYALFHKERKVKATLEEVDSLFFIKDMALSAGYVGTHFSKSICNRIVDTYMSWITYLHNIVLSPSSMIYMNEGKMLSETDKKDMLKLISEIMALVSTNTVLGLTRDESGEAAFIDEAVRFWNNVFKPRIVVVATKINDGWKK